jgi:telomere length regulation protein
VTSEADKDWWRADTTVVSACAGLLHLILCTEESRKSQIMIWLTGSSGAGVGDGIAIRRAVLAALAAENPDMETVLGKSLQQFGDQLYIKHTPTMQQEGKCPIPLLI